MWINLLKEIVDVDGKVTFRKMISLFAKTTTPEVVETFEKQGYIFVDMTPFALK